MKFECCETCIFSKDRDIPEWAFLSELSCDKCEMGSEYVEVEDDE